MLAAFFHSCLSALPRMHVGVARLAARFTTIYHGAHGVGDIIRSH